jgi:hypothetical protein
MSRRTIRMLSVIALGLACVQCASSGVDANRLWFNVNVGTASTNEAYAKSMKVLRQYAFEMEREDVESRVTLLTRWRSRSPLPDEAALGIRQAQNRILVQTRPRAETGAGQFFAVDVTIENRVMLAGSADWSDATATAGYRSWAGKIIDDFKREFDVGVRRF